MPPHKLRLKIGSRIVLLRNFTIHLHHAMEHVGSSGNVLEATILIGKFNGEIVQLPRVPITFNRLQSPIRLNFAMTINKYQGHFSLIWVAYSRVGKPTNLFTLAKDRSTKNNVNRLTINDIKILYCYNLKC
ncbi:ATP-dependent DNA helicase [Trichonephila clavipes]|nr:ATP-dependent DNA helicase [Trichonephila clavipes]